MKCYFDYRFSTRVGKVAEVSRRSAALLQIRSDILAVKNIYWGEYQ